MAATKLSESPAATTFADDDLFDVLDVSDVTMAASGTNKGITGANLKAQLRSQIAPAIFIPAASMIPPASGGATINTGNGGGATNYDWLEFDDVVQQSCTCWFPLPVGWSGTIVVAILWTSAEAADDVYWRIDAGKVSVGGGLNFSLAVNNAGVHSITAANSFESTVASATLALSAVPTDIIGISISRDPSDTGDTLAGVARLKGIVVSNVP